MISALFSPFLLLLFSQVALSNPLPLHSRQTSNSLDSSQHDHLVGKSAPRSSAAIVTNAAAFASGAGNTNNANTADSSVLAANVYNCYSGPAAKFPPQSAWTSFEAMWAANSAALGRGCAVFGVGPENTAQQIKNIYDAIQTVAKTSLVDHRFILAVIMQESVGCVHVPTTNNGISNPGIMQSFEGSAFVGNQASAEEQAQSITQMVIDGTQGTLTGSGLVQGINTYGNIYAAARIYNSGSVDTANLNNGLGSTPSYVVDIANRMTGWVDAPKSSC